jgi:hypothetical protein
VAAKKNISLSNKVIHIAKDFEYRILSQVLLEITVAALHRAVAGKINYKIVAAHLPLASRTLF